MSRCQIVLVDNQNSTTWHEKRNITKWWTWTKWIQSQFGRASPSSGSYTVVEPREAQQTSSTGCSCLLGARARERVELELFFLALQSEIVEYINAWAEAAAGGVLPKRLQVAIGIVVYMHHAWHQNTRPVWETNLHIKDMDAEMQRIEFGPCRCSCTHA